MKEGVLYLPSAAKVEIWQKEGQGRKRRKKPGYISARDILLSNFSQDRYIIIRTYIKDNIYRKGSVSRMSIPVYKVC
jgi:hypothetical protein